MSGNIERRDAIRRTAVALCVALSAACGGGETSEPSEIWTPSEGTTTGPVQSTGGRASVGDAAARGIHGAVMPSTPYATLENAGEIELARGKVQRAYRVRFHNGPRAQTGLVAELVATGSGATVVDGRVVLGNLVPGAVITPDDTITLSHDSDLVIDVTALRWKLTESAHEDGAAGALLRGPAEGMAVDALRMYKLPMPTLGTAAVGESLTAFPGSRLSAVLQRHATVEQVNAALLGVNARIAEMRPGNRTVLLALADPGDAQVLQRIAQRLREAAAFESVVLPPPSAAAPIPETAPDPEPDFNDHRDV